MSEPSPAPRRPWPPFGLGLLVWVLLSGVGAELYLYRFFEDRTHLQHAVDEWRADAARDQAPVWMFGTCHANDLHAAVIEDAWGGGALINVGAPASTPMDWYVAARRMVEEGPPPRAILVSPAGSDLQLRPSPWSSQTMELATWGDLPGILSASCQDLGCAGDLGLRKLSRVFRYRGYLGHLAWSAIGVPPPAAANGGSLSVEFSPDRFRGAALPPPDGIVTEREGWLTPTLRLRPEIWALESSSPLLEPTLDPYHWTRKMVALGDELGVPVLLYQIPARPTGERDQQIRELRLELSRFSEQVGATFLGHPDLSALRPEHFLDDQHMQLDAQLIVSRDLGLALAALDPAVLGPWTGTLPPRPPPPPPPPTGPVGPPLR